MEIRKHQEKSRSRWENEKKEFYEREGMVREVERKKREGQSIVRHLERRRRGCVETWNSYHIYCIDVGILDEVSGID